MHLVRNVLIYIIPTFADSLINGINLLVDMDGTINPVQGIRHYSLISQHQLTN